MTTEPDLFSFAVEAECRYLRDQGIAKVSGNNDNWLQCCINEAIVFSRRRLSFTGEDIRSFCEQAGLYPSHSNAWGALTNTLIKRGLIKKTGEYRQMKDPRSHARETAVYTRT